MMNRTLWISIALALAIAPACKKKENAAPADPAPAGDQPAPATKPAEPTAPAAVIGKWTDMPNIDGFTADIPASAQPNGIGGAAGYHADDKSFLLLWSETSAEEQAKDLDAAKKDTEAFLFSKWIKSEKTADGWLLQWEAVTVDDDAKPVGTQVAMEVRRAVGGKTYTCHGAAPTKDQADVIEKSCLSVRAK